MGSLCDNTKMDEGKLREGRVLHINGILSLDLMNGNLTKCFVEYERKIRSGNERNGKDTETRSR